MSAQIISLIVGAVLIVIAIFLKSNKLKIILGIIGFISIMYGSYTGSSMMPGQIEQATVGNKLQVDFPIKKVQVISPLEGDAVKCRILTMGVYPDSHEKDIWVLLKPSDKKYYPQADHTNTSYKRNGEWQVITRFGGDEGESYDIIVYETDSSASQFFSNTIQKWNESLSYPGLETLPQGAKEVDRITVSLKDNCRGVF